VLQCRKPREFDYNKLVPLVYIPALSLCALPPGMHHAGACSTAIDIVTHALQPPALVHASCPLPMFDQSCMHHPVHAPQRDPEP
jgi:hypothetical protein